MCSDSHLVNTNTPSMALEFTGEKKQAIEDKGS